MDILQGLQSILGDSLTGGQPATNQSGAPAGGGGLGALSGLLNPAVLGGLASALFPNKTGASAAGAAGGGGDLLGGLLGSLFSGGAAQSIPQEHLDKITQANRDVPQFGTAPSNPKDRAERLLRALVYAAKADGHIDDQERAALKQQMKSLNMGPEGQALLQQAMDEPLDPSRIASGLTDPQEAVQIYALSAALTNSDQYMEKAYLDNLATALRIPAEVRNAVAAKLQQGR